MTGYMTRSRVVREAACKDVNRSHDGPSLLWQDRGVFICGVSLQPQCCAGKRTLTWGNYGAVEPSVSYGGQDNVLALISTLLGCMRLFSATIYLSNCFTRLVQSRLLKANPDYFFSPSVMIRCIFVPFKSILYCAFEKYSPLNFNKIK